MRPFPRLPLLLCALTLGLASGARALPTFTASPQGDWFDGASWSGGVAPGPGDSPAVLNESFAVASSASPLYPGGGAVVAVNDVLVGSRLDASLPSEVAGGVATVDVDLVAARDLLVGADLDTAEDVSHDVAGFLNSTAGDQAAGDVTARGRVLIGSTGASRSFAFGQVNVAGDLETGERLLVGSSSRGVAQGSAAVAGNLRIVTLENLSGYGEAIVQVGSSVSALAEADDTTTGSLSVAGDMSTIFEGEFRSTDFSVGYAYGAGRSARGLAEVGGDLLGFTSVQVGVANGYDALLTEVEAFAQGELHVAGKLADSPLPAGYPRYLVVGSAAADPFGGGSAYADGVATIGEIEGRAVAVGIASNAIAFGRVEIGSGDLLITDVGVVTGNGEAQGKLTTGGGILSTSRVGVSEGGGAFHPNCMCVEPFATGNALGFVEAGGFVHSATVGLLRSDGSAFGELEVEGVRRSFQTNTGPVLVGFSDRSGSAGTASGRMLVHSGMEVTRVVVGALEGSHLPTNNPAIARGSVVGALETFGDVTSRSRVGSTTLFDAVGYGNAYSTGVADGTWVMHEGTYTGGRLLVGGSDGTGSGKGRIHLDRMFVDLGELLLGDGATIEIEIAGLLRGSEYSAIDAGRASLNGALAIAFTEPAQLGVYDLIVSSALDGIFGDFDAVSVAGLAAGQSAHWGIETAGGASPVEIWRLYVVPEPHTAALVALGVLAIAIRARRAREAG